MLFPRLTVEVPDTWRLARGLAAATAARRKASKLCMIGTQKENANVSNGKENWLLTEDWKSYSTLPSYTCLGRKNSLPHRCQGVCRSTQEEYIPSDAGNAWILHDSTSLRRCIPTTIVLEGNGPCLTTLRREMMNVNLWRVAVPAAR